MKDMDMLCKLKWTFIVLVCGSAAVWGLIEKGKGVKMTFQDRWVIMDYHNTLRREMNASNMKELVNYITLFPTKKFNRTSSDNLKSLS